jgi:predicted nucleic acid-binding Zn ribbon protein
MRRLAPRPLSGALERVTGSLAPATTLARVQGCWTDVAGALVASEAQPVSERAGVLTVQCRSAVWAQELELLSEDLSKRLNAALGEAPGRPRIERVRFVSGGRPRSS